MCRVVMRRLSVLARRSDMHALSPKTTLICVLLVVYQAKFTCCLTINKVAHTDTIAKTRIELKSLFIPCFLNDVVRISAPIINEESLYYLHKPNGDVMTLEIHSPKLRNIEFAQDAPTIMMKFFNNVKPIISHINNYDVFSVTAADELQVYGSKFYKVEENDFVIGPLSTEDNGNWVLSIYTKDFNGDSIELFQVITVMITEYVPLTPPEPILSLGDTFNLSFAFPITNLKSCELVAPRSTFDRFFDRRRIDMNNCGFTIPNITRQDVGLWRIVAVGKIVYEGEVTLYVDSEKKNNKTTALYFIIFSYFLLPISICLFY